MAPRRELRFQSVKAMRDAEERREDHHRDGEQECGQQEQAPAGRPRHVLIDLAGASATHHPR